MRKAAGRGQKAEGNHPSGRSRCLLLTLAMLAALTGCERHSEDITLRLGHSLDTAHPVHQAMELMAAELENRSGGKVHLKIYPNSLLGSERDMIELVQLGSIDLVKTSTSPLEGFVPGVGVFGIPYVFRDAEHYWKVINGPIGRRLLDLGIAKKLKGLCYYDAGSRSFYTKERQVRTPADLKGLKIRVQNSRAAIRLVEAMGGAATPIPFGELYTALDQGVVDGAENNPPSLLTSRHYEVCKYYSLDEHTRVPDVILISTETWERLKPEHREWLQEAADVSAKFQRDLWARKTQETIDQLSDAGVEILRPNKSQFEEAVRDLQASYQGTEAGKYMKEILGVK